MLCASEFLLKRARRFHYSSTNTLEVGREWETIEMYVRNGTPLRSLSVHEGAVVLVSISIYEDIRPISSNRARKKIHLDLWHQTDHPGREFHLKVPPPFEDVDNLAAFRFQ